MIGRVKERMTLSVDEQVAAYLRRAAAVTGGNVSAYVEQHFRATALAESVAAHADWYAAHPGYAADAEAERHAADAA